MHTDKNPLTYVMTTPSLDTIGHWWVVELAGFNMTIEYLKGIDNKVADVLSHILQCLDLEMVTVLLSHARASNIPWAEADEPQVMECTARPMRMSSSVSTKWQKDFILKDDLLFLKVTLANSLETVTVFIVPAGNARPPLMGATEVLVIKAETIP